MAIQMSLIAQQATIILSHICNLRTIVFLVSQVTIVKLALCSQPVFVIVVISVLLERDHLLLAQLSHLMITYSPAYVQPVITALLVLLIQLNVL